MPSPPPYRDVSLPVGDRVADLLGRMTLDEKAAQLTAPTAPAVDVHEPPSTGWGGVVAALASVEASPREIAAAVNELQRKHVEDTRLGIPVLVAEEALVGLKIHGATVFPDAIAQAATWDPELIERMGTAIGIQMARTGARQALSPLADTTRDPRWGRVEETYGEEPYLVGSMATAFVRGLQEADAETPLVATVKHFLGYSASAGGRNTESASIGPRELREVHSVPFEMVIRDGRARGIMPAYVDIDGVPVTGSREYLTDLLHGELGFHGLVMSDLGAVNQLYTKHGTAHGDAAASAQAVQAGVHLDLVPRLTTHHLIEAVESGLLPVEDLDRAVSTVLRTKFELGLFERPYVELDAVPETLDPAETRALSRTIAEQSVVLLRNEPVDGTPLLPLDPDTRTIAVIGPNADRLLGQLGNYSYPVLESMAKRFALAADPTARADEAAEFAGNTGPDQARLMVESVPVVTFLDGIRARARDATVRYERGCPIQDEDRSGIPAAVEAAKSADVAVVVVGDQGGINAFGTVGEGLDSATCELPGVQRELVEAVLATGTPTVVVLSHGRPYSLKWMADSVPAIVTSWFGGEEAGSATAAVLFGDVNPGGRLPISFLDFAGSAPLPYWRAAQTPPYIEGRAGATFPFGHGLSYTDFEYRDMEIKQPEVPTDGAVELSFTVVNVGERAGDEVVQVYGQDVTGRTVRPRRKLVAFRRLSLEAGEGARITATVPASLFALWDPREGWLVEPGKIKFFIGGSSAQVRLRTSVTLTGDVHRPGRERPLTSSVSAVPVDPDVETVTRSAASFRAAGPLSGDNTVLEWLEHPIGGELLRGLLQGADEETLAPAFGMPLTQMAMYSGGRFPAETVDRLVAEVHAGMPAPEGGPAR
ncbi:glycoside hydrolase family 3 N-terminal domain-containing protein [Amycolatopsis balhimycina]|uniref:glycoside hydrolase family 3 N-terminal domain-containing protein n=1 Tax=Amycolatopsis balhimycina TaxID=208443 RepID=UPI001B7FA644|nr:glycoside hydrolase family 3 N-terminal domain-containing protein [Amycolatopsis balhimycina]